MRIAPSDDFAIVDTVDHFPDAVRGNIKVAASLEALEKRLATLAYIVHPLISFIQPNIHLSFLLLYHPG